MTWSNYIDEDMHTRAQCMYSMALKRIWFCDYNTILSPNMSQWQILYQKRNEETRIFAARTPLAIGRCARRISNFRNNWLQNVVYGNRCSHSMQRTAFWFVVVAAVIEFFFSPFSTLEMRVHISKMVNSTTQKRYSLIRCTLFYV